ncbi:MAG TPA: sigma-70 family RNA polymerase sigma factor [Anaeromyxobacter sp.]|nr:sigma-70 family RNA polymerase sigma factor [Anaeromyxobacter sp.]
MPTDAARAVLPDRATADEDLVDEVRAGRRARFGLLVARHEARLRRAVGAVLHNRSEVDDAVQQAFSQALAGLDRFSGAAAFATWLRRIAVNEALLRARRSRRAERALATLGAHGEGVVGTPEQDAARREDLRRIEAALPRLAEPHRRVLHLVIEEMSTAEIAEHLGVSEGAVKVRVHRAREALRRAVDGGPPKGGRPHLVLAAGRASLIGSGPCGVVQQRQSRGAGPPPGKA